MIVVANQSYNLADYALITLLLLLIMKLIIKKLKINNIVHNIIVLIFFGLLAIIFRMLWITLFSILFLNYKKEKE